MCLRRCKSANCLLKQLPLDMKYSCSNVPGPSRCIPRAVLAGVASLLIQKETQERTTVKIQGM